MQRRTFLLGAAAVGLAGAVPHARASGFLSSPALAARSPLPAAAHGDAALLHAWAAIHAPQTAMLVVRRNGRIAAHGHGVNPQATTPIASLSKAITAAAVATLIRDGRLSFTTPMRDALAGFFRRYALPLDPRFMEVTVEQLLVHRSGLLGNPDRDPMNAIRRHRAARGLAHVAAPQPLIAQHLRRYPLAREPGSRFVYSNTGYLTLAAVIEEAAGRGYEEYCRAAVLTPLGVRSAYLHADRRLSSGSGGWSITGADYLAFLDVFDPRHPLLGEAVQQWIAAARTRWGANRRGGWYSLGVQTSASGAGRQVQHNGLLFLHGKPRRDRASALALRSFARRKASGDGLFIAVTQMRAKRESLRDLIAAVEATFPDARA